MRLAIIELHYHSECLNSLCQILRNTTFNTVSIYSSQKIFNDINNINFSKFDWIVNYEKTKKEFFLNHFEEINNNDIVLILTANLETQIPYYRLNGPTTILRIHNANTWFKRLKNIKFGPTPFLFFKDISYILRILLLKMDFQYLKKIKNSIDYTTFTTNNATRYIKNQNLYSSIKIIPPIPIAVWDKNFLKQHNSNKIWITVPGSIDKRRRDYKLIFCIFKDLLTKLKRKTILCFLGKPKGLYGKKIIKKFQKIQNKNFRFVYFNKRIPQNTFNKFMKTTDILLSTILVETKYKIYYEKYGKTKLSGLESDIVRYGKPAILPHTYTPDKKLNPICKFYEDYESLKKLLLSIINNYNDLVKLEKKINRILPYYRVDKMLTKTEKILRQALQNKTN